MQSKEGRTTYDAPHSLLLLEDGPTAATKCFEVLHLNRSAVDVSATGLLQTHFVLCEKYGSAVKL